MIECGRTDSEIDSDEGDRGCEEIKHTVTTKIHDSSICLVRNKSIEVVDKLDSK